MIEITPEIVWEKARLLRQAAANIQANFEVVDQQIQFLSSSENFDGRAAQDVLDEYMRIRNQLMTMPQLLQDYALRLDNAANDFDELDRRLSNPNL